MTTTAATRPSRSLPRLLTVLTAVVGLLAGLTGTASASTDTQPGSSSRLTHLAGLKTRVGVAATPPGLFVGPQTPGSPTGIRKTGCGYDRTTVGSCVATNTGVNIEGANFAQKTAGASFSADGAFAGASRAEIVAKLRSGVLKPGDVPIEVIVRDGNTLILNTRSATALAEAGVPRSAWNVVNVSGDAAAQARLTAQLARNGLTSAGTPTVRAK